MVGETCSPPARSRRLDRQRCTPLDRRKAGVTCADRVAMRLADWVGGRWAGGRQWRCACAWPSAAVGTRAMSSDASPVVSGTAQMRPMQPINVARTGSAMSCVLSASPSRCRRLRSLRSSPQDHPDRHGRLREPCFPNLSTSARHLSLGSDALAAICGEAGSTSARTRSVTNGRPGHVVIGTLHSDLTTNPARSARRRRVFSCARYRESPARRSPPRRALVPPRNESAGGQPLCPAPPETSAPGPSGGAIHRERLNEPEVALAR